MAAAPVTSQIPAAALAGDVAIAAPGSKDEGYGYVGVWAKDAAACATVGDPSATGYVVITTYTYRDSTGTWYGSFGALADGKISLVAGAKSVALEQTSPDALAIDGVQMVRCTP